MTVLFLTVLFAVFPGLEDLREGREFTLQNKALYMIEYLLSSRGGLLERKKLVTS